MKNTYIYPAIFHYDDDGISISYPDLDGCFSYANTEENALKNAREALALHMYGIEEDHEDIPTPTCVKNITLKENELVVLIDVYMPLWRDKIENKTVKKTLTIPSWLNIQAERCNINFSQTLQEALKQKLNVK
jgi:predicted RNase H-like HicB family nuclease